MEGCSREIPSLANASTTCAVTSTEGGSSASPKSQNGILVRIVLSLSLSKAPQPPPRLCMAINQSTARANALSMPLALNLGSLRNGARAISATAVSSMSG